jgi:ribonuclease-3
VDEFCQKLGYSFTRRELLLEALTTPECKMDSPRITDNQRLEFLGDAVLGLLAGEKLFRDFPSAAEGRLTVMRTHMVSSAALCGAAHRIGLVPRLKRNRAAAPLPADSKTIADAVEALVGAAYVDGGLSAARKVFDSLELSENAEAGSWSANPKGDLQIKTQAMNPPRRPAYELLGTTGPDHAPVFKVRVSVEGLGEAVMSAGNRREAESLAAAALLKSLESSDHLG